jgi:hypothetical protein
MNSQWKLLTAALAIFSMLFLCYSALAGESANYKSYPQVSDNSGGRSVSSTYQARASTGQPAIGPSESTTGTFFAGYLYSACAMPAPKTNKNIAISRLQSIRHLFRSESDKRKADEAILHIENSLNSLLWMSPWRLNQSRRDKQHMDGFGPGGQPTEEGLILVELDGQSYLGEKRSGDEVFKHEKEAAKKIKELLNKKLPPGAILELLAAAGNLMEADSMLASIKIVEADLSGGNPQEMRKARVNMMKAERQKQKANPEYGEVVDFYGKAWHRAVKAEEKGGGIPGVQVGLLQDSKPVFALGKLYPNPSRLNASVAFGIAEPCRVRLRIYDVTGRLVRTLVDEERHPGYYSCQWDSRDERGERVASGTYICRMTAGSYASARMLVLAR